MTTATRVSVTTTERVLLDLHDAPQVSDGTLTFVPTRMEKIIHNGVIRSVILTGPGGRTPGALYVAYRAQDAPDWVVGLL